MKFLLLIALSFVLAGCITSVDAKFEPLSENSEYLLYMFSVPANFDESPEKETERLKWLDRRVGAYGFDKSKYEVIERNEYSNPDSKRKRITYQVKIYKH